MATEAREYVLSLCWSCAHGRHSGTYVLGCAFCDVDQDPERGLHKYLRPASSSSVESGDTDA